MFFFPKITTVFLAAASMSFTANGHGYLKTPRSRNIVAAEDGVSWGGSSSDPAPEYCPQCLNRGGSVAACGKVDGRNYDFPPNSIGGVMPTNIQATVAKGGTIDFEVVLTAHHKGHFSFYACPVTTPGEAPSNDCFKKHPLVFEEDLLYGAPKDSSFPDRAYIPPLTYSGIVNDNDGQVPGTLYKYRMKLPDDIEGDFVLLQWHYLSANSCVHEGYGDYDFPAKWGDVNYSHLPSCGVIPEDGNGVPEQFWNCAEVKVESDGTTPVPPSPTSAPETPSEPTDPVTPAPETPTPAPTTGSPATPAPTPEGGLEVSTSARCGVSELDAHGNCGVECSTTADCASGQWCWNVHDNYCGNRPNFAVCDDLPQANSNSRCGVNELEAREFCGKSCVSDGECGAGEKCWATQMNTCDCVSNGSNTNGSRFLRGFSN